MSKEFEEWFESEREKMRQGKGNEMYLAAVVHPGDLKRAFEAGTAAGRALGRREAGRVLTSHKGKHGIVADSLIDTYVAAIEAIPEEG